MDKLNTASWLAVAVSLTGLAVYTAVDRNGLTAHVPHRSPTSPASTTNTPNKPELSIDLAFRVDADTSKGETTYSFIARNFGDEGLTITSLARSGPGLQLLHASANPATVPPHGRTTVTATYRVTDCALVPRSSWPMPVTLISAGNQSTQALDLGGTSPDTPWQAAAADAVCHPQSATP